MKREELNEILWLHKLWLVNDPSGMKANLRDADLRDANLDYSCWPLWCGSKNVKIDRKQAIQLLAHFVATDCDDPEINKLKNLKSVKKLCAEFHHPELFN